MILSSLYMRDYKQFAGEHTFEPDRQGITAVIGPNGAGKTTLFEAIEWCLYGPRSIANSDVLPRGLGGTPLVRVTLEEPRTGQRYVIERRLSRSKVMQAEVWDEANSGDMLATGSAPVKKFVSEQLIGLGHAAFVSTFFTRQKELSFFGSVGDTKRRRMVGQMIGVEAVRLAQEAIGEERARAAATADALGAVAAQDTEQRDLPAEIAEAERNLAAASDDVARRMAESAAARQSLERANAAADRARERAEQDRALAGEIAEQEAARARLEARIEGFDADLARLVEQAKRRESLAPIAATLAERQAECDRWTAEQRKRVQIDERTRSLSDIADERAGIARTAQRLVAESATQLLPAWTWQSSNQPDAEIARLLAAWAELDLAADREHLKRLEAVAAQVRDLEKAQGDLEKYRARIEQLNRDEQALLRQGDPAVSAGQLRTTIEEHRSLVTRHETERAQALDRARQLEPLVASLRSRTFDDHCPTCGRSITEKESAGVIATLADQIDGWNQIAAQRASDAASALTAISGLSRQLADTEQVLEQLNGVRSRLASGQHLTSEKQGEAEQLQRALDELLGSLGIAPPTADDLARARERVDALSTVDGAAQGLTQRHAQLQDLARREIREREALAQLGESVYNAATHRAATAALDEANHAVATLANIDRELARRDAILSQRAESATTLDQCTAAIAKTSERRTSLAYSDVEAGTAREMVNTALEADRTATSRLHLAQTAEREKNGALTRLRDELKRLQQQLERSAVLRRQADELSEMYKEFGVFDQYVAQRIAPRLAEQTSELLEIATDGKYTSVEFDENYGIEVYDGTTEKFPLEGFSGGERDVVSLCARLSLSQVIGSSAAHPPSFLVLDEVFGALDRDRRVQLLELLGRISETIDAFQQMFIISHVDDVRSSPIFTRVIRIVETPDGSSSIEDATVSAGLEE
jgi:exonuclease SbcC